MQKVCFIDLQLRFKQITDEDLNRAISDINKVSTKRVFLSGHDTCDHALHRTRLWTSILFALSRSASFPDPMRGCVNPLSAT